MDQLKQKLPPPPQIPTDGHFKHPCSQWVYLLLLMIFSSFNSLGFHVSDRTEVVGEELWRQHAIAYSIECGWESNICRFFNFNILFTRVTIKTAANTVFVDRQKIILIYVTWPATSDGNFQIENTTLVCNNVHRSWCRRRICLQISNINIFFLNKT